MPVFSHSRSVRFQEVDAAGIVFFARFFEWFHDAYAELLAGRGIRFEKKFFEQSDWGLPLAHAEADYREPLGLGAQIRVEIESVVVGDTSITVSYAVRSGADKLHATGKTVHVCIDRKTFRPRAVPPELRAVAA